MIKNDVLKPVYAAKEEAERQVEWAKKAWHCIDDCGKLGKGRMMSSEKADKMIQSYRCVKNPCLGRERQKYAKKESLCTARQCRDFGVGAGTPSVNSVRYYSPKPVFFVLGVEEKHKMHSVKIAKSGYSKERTSTSPKLNYTEIKANLPRSDGDKIAVHKYALPQALVPIHNTLQHEKTQNNLIDTVNPNPVPYFRKGLSGWKISIKGYYKKKLKQIENLVN